MDDRQALANSMMKSATESVSKLRSGDPPTIYKVTQDFRQENEVAYEPRMVSIGPYHNGKERLQGMEEHKWQFLHSILSRNPNHKLEDYLKAIEELEDQARSCYSDNVDPQMGKEFVKMMVLDGCFIVEFFLRLREYTKESMEFNENRMLHLTGYDLLIFENQIPFFILQCIFKMVRTVDKELPYSIATLAFDFFHIFVPMKIEIKSMDYSIHHLLHLFHLHLIPTLTPSKESDLVRNPTVEFIANKWKKMLLFLNSKGFFPSSNKNQLPISNNPSPPRWIDMIPCAVELQLAGIKLKKKEKWSSILEVKFRDGELEIPSFFITNATIAIFQNLVAFENIYPKAGNDFTTYVWFMSYLLKTYKDVELLEQNGIIDYLSPTEKEVACQFKRLSNHTSLYRNNYLSGLYRDVDKHCKTDWNKWCASLKRDYFTNPWSGLSSIAAVILLLLTFSQTFFAVFAYFRPPT